MRVKVEINTYERTTASDVFDLWIALTEMNLDPEEIVTCFEPYRPETYTRRDALTNFDSKLRHDGFRHDLDSLVLDPPDGYSIDEAGALVRSQLLDRV